MHKCEQTLQNERALKRKMENEMDTLDEEVGRLTDQLDKIEVKNEAIVNFIFKNFIFYFRRNKYVLKTAQFVV